jgi:hypothetical protein
LIAPRVRAVREPPLLCPIGRRSCTNGPSSGA